MKLDGQSACGCGYRRVRSATVSCCSVRVVEIYKCCAAQKRLFRSLGSKCGTNNCANLSLGTICTFLILESPLLLSNAFFQLNQCNMMVVLPISNCVMSKSAMIIHLCLANQCVDLAVSRVFAKAKPQFHLSLSPGNHCQIIVCCKGVCRTKKQRKQLEAPICMTSREIGP